MLGAGDAARGDSSRSQPQPHSTGQKQRSGQRTGMGEKEHYQAGKEEAYRKEDGGAVTTLLLCQRHRQ